MQIYNNKPQKSKVMKNIYFTLVLVLTSIISSAAIIHVDMNKERPAGYYGDLQLAINNANSGDTIFIYPANNDYGHITIKKQLHLFGFGYDGNINGVSRIDRLYLDTNATENTNSSGSSIQGLTIDYFYIQKHNINNISLIGNYIRYSIILTNNCSNFTIKNNYIGSYLNIDGASNVVISNNIFRGGDNLSIYSSNSSSNVISNNLFMSFRHFNNVSNAIVSNNIFICSYDANQTYMNNNNFQNNLSWRSTLDPYPLPPTGNTGSGNISNQDPLFETGQASGAFDIYKDYNLKSTSPGKNAGTDGTDIGPYGGTNPFVWGGAFTIPKVTELVIETPVVDQGTSVNVKLKAEKAQY